MVTTFVKESILERDTESGKYRLSPVMLELGLIAETADPMIQISRAEIDNLHLATGCRASLYIREETEAVCLYAAGDEIVSSGQRVDIPFLVSGWTMLAYLDEDAGLFLKIYWPELFASSKGRELMKRIKQIEREGVAFGIEPFVQDEFSIACPIFDLQGKALGTVTLTTGISNSHVCQSFISILSKTAQQISRELSECVS